MFSLQTAQQKQAMLTDKDWEAHKQLIREKYLVENKTLTETKDALGSLGFIVTYALPKTPLRHFSQD